MSKHLDALVAEWREEAKRLRHDAVVAPLLRGKYYDEAGVYERCAFALEAALNPTNSISAADELRAAITAQFDKVWHEP